MASSNSVALFSLSFLILFQKVFSQNATNPSAASTSTDCPTTDFQLDSTNSFCYYVTSSANFQTNKDICDSYDSSELWVPKTQSEFNNALSTATGFNTSTIWIGIQYYVTAAMYQYVLDDSGVQVGEFTSPNNTNTSAWYNGTSYPPTVTSVGDGSASGYINESQKICVQMSPDSKNLWLYSLKPASCNGDAIAVCYAPQGAYTTTTKAATKTVVYVQSTTSMSLDEYIYLAFRNNGYKYTSMKWTVILVASLVLVKNVLL